MCLMINYFNVLIVSTQILATNISGAPGREMSETVLRRDHAAGVRPPTHVNSSQSTKRRSNVNSNLMFYFHIKNLQFKTDADSVR